MGLDQHANTSKTTQHDFVNLLEVLKHLGINMCIQRLLVRERERALRFVGTRRK